jgi:tetratricopeptide (TPR) repeat protein
VRVKCHRATVVILGLAAVVGVTAPGAPAAGMGNSSASPESASAPLQLAQREFGAGNYPAAIAMLRSVVSQDGMNAEAFYWLGRCYYETRDFDQAIAYAGRAVALQPQNSVYEQWLGRDYAAKADCDKSYFAARKIKKRFEKAVELDPRNVSARRDLAEFCAQAPWIVGGDEDEAVRQIDAIAAIDPVEGHLARAWFDAQVLKKSDLANSEYKQALAAKPGDPQPYFDAVVFYRQQNRPSEMNAVLDAVARVRPNDPRLTFYRAEAMIIAGTNFDRAAEYIKSYLASTPDRSDWPSHARARVWLGRLYEIEGHHAEAAEQYRASLQLGPGRASVQTHLERLEKESL